MLAACKIRLKSVSLLASTQRQLSSSAVSPNLPPLLYLCGYHNEDAKVEAELIKHQFNRTGKPLRILSVAASGTHTIVMASSPHVKSIDSVDTSPGQIMVSNLTRAAAIGLQTPEELAMFLGTGGTNDARLSYYKNNVRKHLSTYIADFWDENIETVKFGTMNCGGADRMYVEFRALLPTQDWNTLQKHLQTHSMKN